MKKTLKSFAALALTVSGLAMATTANAATKTTCYKGTASKTVTTKTCPAGWSTSKPVAAVAQGSGQKGDIDLTTPGSVTLNMNGSSFDAPLIGVQINGPGSYSALNSKVSFGSYAAAGSGAGRTGITNGSLDIGFSDQPMAASAGTIPSGVTVTNYAQLPYALGGAVVAYNLGTGLDNVKLTAPEIADIYDGKITQWSDPMIVTTNGGSASTLGQKLVALKNSAQDTIKVLYRGASSGTTYAFTDYLNAAGASGHTPSGNVMEGSGGWGASNILAAANNAAMAADLLANPGSIGYVEYSYVLANPNSIQIAELQDYNQQWLAPSMTNIAAAATAAGANITPENFSIVFQRGNNVWPLATYSWAIVAKSQADPNKGEAIVKFLDWATHGGQDAFAANNGFIPLPPAAREYARSILSEVTSGSTTLLANQN